jgi:hypothetical protein
MPIRPFARRLMDAVIPPMARWLVALMRRLEEDVESPAARWELLRRKLEQIGRGP